MDGSHHNNFLTFIHCTISHLTHNIEHFRAEIFRMIPSQLSEIQYMIHLLWQQLITLFDHLPDPNHPGADSDSDTFKSYQFSKQAIDKLIQQKQLYKSMNDQIYSELLESRVIIDNLKSKIRSHSDASHSSPENPIHKQQLWIPNQHMPRCEKPSMNNRKREPNTRIKTRKNSCCVRKRKASISHQTKDILGDIEVKIGGKDWGEDNRRINKTMRVGKNLQGTYKVKLGSKNKTKFITDYLDEEVTSQGMRCQHKNRHQDHGSVKRWNPEKVVLTSSQQFKKYIRQQIKKAMKTVY